MTNSSIYIPLFYFASQFEMDDEFGGLGPPEKYDPTGEPGNQTASGENTTIAIVATDADLTQAQTTRLATAAHDGMARAIVPAHTLFDGDLVFAAATGEKPIGDPAVDPMKLGHACAVALSRAIARAVFKASTSSVSFVAKPDASCLAQVCS